MKKILLFLFILFFLIGGGFFVYMKFAGTGGGDSLLPDTLTKHGQDSPVFDMDFIAGLNRKITDFLGSADPVADLYFNGIPLVPGMIASKGDPALNVTVSSSFTMVHPLFQRETAFFAGEDSGNKVSLGYAGKEVKIPIPHSVTADVFYLPGKGAVPVSASLVWEREVMAQNEWMSLFSDFRPAIGVNQDGGNELVLAGPHSSSLTILLDPGDAARVLRTTLLLKSGSTVRTAGVSSVVSEILGGYEKTFESKNGKRGGWEWRSRGKYPPSQWVTGTSVRGAFSSHLLKEWTDRTDLPIITGNAVYWNGYLAQINLVMEKKVWDRAITEIASAYGIKPFTVFTSSDDEFEFLVDDRKNDCVLVTIYDRRIGKYIEIIETPAFYREIEKIRSPSKEPPAKGE